MEGLGGTRPSRGQTITVPWTGIRAPCRRGIVCPVHHGVCNAPTTEDSPRLQGQTAQRHRLIEPTLHPGNRLRKQSLHVLSKRCSVCTVDARRKQLGTSITGLSNAKGPLSGPATRYGQTTCQRHQSRGYLLGHFGSCNSGSRPRPQRPVPRASESGHIPCPRPGDNFPA